MKSPKLWVLYITFQKSYVLMIHVPIKLHVNNMVQTTLVLVKKVNFVLFICLSMRKSYTLINPMYMKLRTIFIQPDPKMSNKFYQISFDYKIEIIKKT